MLRKEQVGRYRDIARLLLRHGGRELVEWIGFGEALDEEAMDTAQQAHAEQLAGDLEALGPTFVKLGQLLSTRADMLPPTYLRALARLQDRVEPFPYHDVERVVLEEFGVGPDELFADFRVEPLAAASLGQVHQATLYDGRCVVVKIQRPGVRDKIESDLSALHQIARWIDEHSEFGQRYNVLQTVRQFRRGITRELDYTREADNLRTLSDNLASFDAIVIPTAIDSLTTARVLTMEYIDGVKITDTTPEQRRHVDGLALTDMLFHAYLRQVFLDGFFHADPHPGNVLLTPQGRVGILDLGMVGHVDQTLQESLLNLLLAVSEGRSDDAADLAVSVGDPTKLFDPRAFRSGIREVLSEHREQRVGEMQIGSLILEVARVAGSSGLRIPAPILLLGKALMNLDEIGRTLAPQFNPQQATRRHALSIIQQRAIRSLNPGQWYSSFVEIKQLFGTLPRRVDRLLNNLADNNLQIKVDAIDEDQLIRGIQKVANRVTAGLVVAALIIGAAMLMHVETEVTLLGYPALAIICFIIAALMGFFLVIDIIWRDMADRHRRHRR